MRTGLLLSVACALWIAFGSCLAAEAPSQAPSAQGEPAGRPRIGLVLGGGGARGVAHIGAIKVLEEMRIPIDYVVGTSMGSIVGGAYATGKSPAQMEEKLRAAD